MMSIRGRGISFFMAEYDYPRKSGIIICKIKARFCYLNWHHYERNRWHTLSEMGGTIKSEISSNPPQSWWPRYGLATIFRYAFFTSQRLLIISFNWSRH